MTDEHKAARQREIEQASKPLKESIDQYFAPMVDPRRSNSVQHKLIDIFFITLCATLAGANTIESITMYAAERKDWLIKFLNLQNGIPSYNTFWWVFVLLKPSEFQECFIKWVQAIAPLTKGENVAIDGKALRGTSIPDDPNSFVHMVSAWGANSNLTLGQFKVDGKSNEITAIPKLLDMIDITGAVVTIDAIGCQTKIAEKIINNGGDYMLALKENQQHLFDEVEHYFNLVDENNLGDGECQLFSSDNSQEKEKHGRIEKRLVYTTSEIDSLLLHKDDWKGIQSIVCVHSFRTIKGKTSEEKRYYITSLPSLAERIGGVIRSHWGIENKVHWTLDVGFLEDKLKARAGNIAANLAVLRHLSLNLLKMDKTTKRSIENKRFKAALNNDYLEDLLKGLIKK